MFLSLRPSVQIRARYVFPKGAVVPHTLQPRHTLTDSIYIVDHFILQL